MEGHWWPRIPDGTHRVQFLHHDTAVTFTVLKVFLHLQVVDPGEHLGVRIYRPYRVQRIIGRAKRHGRFVLGVRHELFVTLVRLYEEHARRTQAPRIRPDRVTLRPLRGCVLEATTRTVTHEHRQRPLPECLRYSVVDELTRIVAGCPRWT